MWICPEPNSMYAKRYAYGFRISWFPRAGDHFVDGDRGFCDSSGVGLTVSQVQARDASGILDDGKPSLCGPRYMPPSKKVMWMCYALGSWAKGGKVGTGSYPWVFPAYAHRDGSTYVYADGHAAWRKMGAGWAPLGYTSLEVDQKP